MCGAELGGGQKRGGVPRVSTRTGVSKESPGLKDLFCSLLACYVRVVDLGDVNKVSFVIKQISPISQISFSMVPQKPWAGGVLFLSFPPP